MTIRELLNDPTKWRKMTAGSLPKGDGSWCLVEAAHECYPDWEERRTVIYPKLNAAIKGDSLGPTFISVITKFNDAEGTTHEDIIRVLDIAGV